jgi:hypothetical protein
MPTNYIELKIPSIQFTKSQFYGELPIKDSLNPNQKCWSNVQSAIRKINKLQRKNILVMFFYQKKTISQNQIQKTIRNI